MKPTPTFGLTANQIRREIKRRSQERLDLLNGHCAGPSTQSVYSELLDILRWIDRAESEEMDMEAQG